MSLINKSQPTLTGGVSRQTPSQRLINQAEVQENFRSSLVNGLQSRPPLIGNSKLNTYFYEAAFYPIDKDSLHRYNLLVSPSGIAVTDAEGVNHTVTIEDGASSYLSRIDLADPYEVYKVLTLADTVYILNTQKTVKLTSDRYSPQVNQALVFIKSVNYATTWTLNINGVTKSFGYGGADTSDGTSAIKYVDGEEEETASGLSTTEVASYLKTIFDYDENNTQTPSLTPYYSYRIPAHTAKHKGVVYYTYDAETNSYKVINTNAEWVELYNNGVAIYTRDTIVPRNGQSSYRYRETIDNTYDSGTTYYKYNSDTDTFSAIADATEWNTLHNAGTSIFFRLTALPQNPAPLTESGTTPFICEQKGAVLWIRRSDNLPFSIGLSDTRADSCSNLITSKIQNFSDLPTTAPDGYICRVSGTISTNSDDYYVQFVADTAGAFGKGVWHECAAPDNKYRIDPATMPHVLKHTSDDTWTFGEANWADKLTGDADSVQPPAFINKTLSNIFLYRNRMAFLCEDMLCMSSAGDYENWWNETATTLLDTDPIYLSASLEKLSLLHDFGILGDTLVLFGDNEQFELSTPDIFSPKTAALVPIAANSYTKATGVVSNGSKLFFGHRSGQHYECLEFGVSSLTGLKEGSSITSHIPNYIPFNWRLRLRGSENADQLAVLSEDAPNELYIYQFYVSNSQKLQSAWSKYVFDPSIIIKGIFYREEVLWVYLSANNIDVIATLDMSERPVLTPDWFNVDTMDLSGFCLDLWTYGNSDEPTTEWDDFDVFGATENLIVLKVLEDGTLTPAEVIKRENGKITLAPKDVAYQVFMGLPYKRKYVFSEQFPTVTKQTGSVAITTGRWQLQQLRLSFDTSGPFEVKVKPCKNTDISYTYKFSGRHSGLPSATIHKVPMDKGVFTVPLRGNAKETEVTIETSSWLPCCFVSAEWQGMYITKVKNI